MEHIKRTYVGNLTVTFSEDTGELCLSAPDVAAYSTNYGSYPATKGTVVSLTLPSVYVASYYVPVHYSVIDPPIKAVSELIQLLGEWLARAEEASKKAHAEADTKNGESTKK
jgi:hypothetical protein